MHAVAANLVAATILAPPPSIYWTSTPTLVNETLLIAGAGLNNTRVRLCLDKGCSKLFSDKLVSASWEHSITLVLPKGCGPPCYVRVDRGSDVDGASVQLINAPEPWFAVSSAFASPAPPLSVLPTPAATITVGDTIRVFGRALAWDGELCVSGATPPPSSTSTTLHVTCNHTTVTLAASAANCWEAAFPTTTATSLVPGECTALVQTSRGVASTPLDLRVEAPPPPVPPATVLDVLGAFGGDLQAALAKAASLSGGGSPVVVELGRHAYTLRDTRLHLPGNVTLRGAGAAHTSIAVSITPGAPRGHAVLEMDGGRGRRALLDLSLVVDASTSVAQTAAVYVSGVEGFEARGLTLTLEQPHVGSAFVLESSRGIELADNVVRQTGSCDRGGARIIQAHRVERVRIAANDVHWSCAVFAFDVSDGVVIEDNRFNGTGYHEGDMTGNGLWTYDIHRRGVRPSSALWSIARNSFIRPPDVSMARANFDETLTTDGMRPPLACAHHLHLARPMCRRVVSPSQSCDTYTAHPVCAHARRSVRCAHRPALVQHGRRLGAAIGGRQAGSAPRAVAARQPARGRDHRRAGRFGRR